MVASQGLPILLFLRDNRNGHQKSFDRNGKRSSLPCRRVLRKPCCPFIVHFRIVIWVMQNKRRRDDVLHRTSRRFHDCFDILQGLASLLPDRRSGQRASTRVLTDLAGYEEQSGRSHGLAVERRLWRRFSFNYVSRHLISPSSLESHAQWAIPTASKLIRDVHGCRYGLERRRSGRGNAHAGSRELVFRGVGMSGKSVRHSTGMDDYGF
jgi:hypothetical protein